MPYEDRYDPDEDFDHWYTDASATLIAQLIRPEDSVLELGCATGRMSAVLAGSRGELVGVDRALTYLERARRRAIPMASFVAADIVVVDLDRRFNHVVVANVLHEVEDPAALMANAARHLAPGGYLHVTLQNPGSIHRVLGREMGLISGLYEVSARGEEFATVRILDADEIESLGRSAGLQPIRREGVMLKPLPNALMADLPDEVLRGLVAAARHFPDLSAMNYLVFRSAFGLDGSDG